MIVQITFILNLENQPKIQFKLKRIDELITTSDLIGRLQVEANTR